MTRWLLLTCLPLVTACASAPKVHFETAPCPAVTPPPDGVTLITGFYEAFSRRDFRGMACSYTDDIEFTDSIFGTLRGKRALAMWAMLTSGDTDLTIRTSRIRAGETAGQAHWDADYTFPFVAFKNEVHNSIDATFELRAGKISRHTDVFDLRRWMTMALWPLDGIISEDTIRSSVQKRLDTFIEDHPEFQDTPKPKAP